MKDESQMVWLRLQEALSQAWSIAGGIADAHEVVDLGLARDLEEDEIDSLRTVRDAADRVVSARYAVPAEMEGDAGWDELAAVLASVGERITYADQSEDNRTRAGFAARGLAAYATTTGVIGESVETAMGDLLNDLHHLADLAGVDWEQVSSQGHYDHETTYRS